MNAVFKYIANLLFSSTQTKPLENLMGLEKTDAILHNLVAGQKVPGMSLTILKEGEIIFKKGYGYANIENKIPVDPSRTIFRIASISKCITSLALGKMVEEGILNFDDSFYKHVPYYPKKEYDFTIRQLANHTAGIRGYRGKEYALNKPYSIKESIEVFKNDPLVFEPGKGYLYNSFDFVLLSLAMKEASGIPFEVYVKEKVLEPLKMTHTFVPNQTTDNLVSFYTKSASGLKKAIEVSNFYKLAGGGYLSTSEDVAKMGQAILEQKLLKKKTYDQLFAPAIIDEKSTYYGLGFQVSQDAKGRDFVGHVGNSVGVYSNFFVYPKENVVVSILVNCTDPKIQKDLEELIRTF